MTKTSFDLDELERRVAEKYDAAWQKHAELWPLPDGPFDITEWTTKAIDQSNRLGAINPPPQHQFPRERWATQPARRTVALIICESWIDRGWDITDPTFLMVYVYGGRIRL